MMKARTVTKDGRPVILIGLDRENTKRLHDGKPIRVDLREAPPKGLLIPGGPILYLIAGETLKDIADELTKAGIEFPS